MKKCIVTLVVIALLFGTIGGVPITAAQDYVWVLVDVIDHDNEKGWDIVNEHDSYNSETSYSRGNYFVKTTYIGKTQGTMINGEGVKLSCVFSTPPEKIYPDQEVPLSFTLSASENTLSFFNFSASVKADFYQPDVDPSYGRGIRFKNEDSVESFTIGGGTNSYLTIQETITAKPNSGHNEGDKIALRQMFYSRDTMATYYVYEWRPVSTLTNPCSVTFNQDLSFTIPNAIYDGGPLVGQMALKLDLKFFGEQNGQLLWQLSNFDTSPSSASCSLSIAPDLSFKLVDAVYDAGPLWGQMNLQAEFKYSGDQNGALLWYLADIKFDDAP